MATTCVAMRGRLGDTEYFVLSMKAEELVTRVRIPREMKGWEDESVEERYQRQIDYHGIRSRIAPYLANDDSRFFGALIAWAAGERITDERRAELLEEYRRQFPEGDRDRELPALV